MKLPKRKKVDDGIKEPGEQQHLLPASSILHKWTSNVDLSGDKDSHNSWQHYPTNVTPATTTTYTVLLWFRTLYIMPTYIVAYEAALGIPEIAGYLAYHALINPNRKTKNTHQHQLA
uniref:Uncharacterized protein n=1 Tax=Glossina austeni TaxID=7395 RepID=A0A1A9VTR4_GLOAU